MRTMLDRCGGRRGMLPDPAAWAPVLACAVFFLSGCSRSAREWIRDLSDEDPFRRLLAVVALRTVEDARVGDALRATLGVTTDPAPRVRIEARKTLRLLAPRHPSLLIDILMGPATPLSDRHECAMALGTGGGEGVIPLLLDTAARAPREALAPLADALVLARPRSLELLEDRLARGDARFRAAAAPLLARFGSPAIGTLEGLLNDGDESVRRAAASALVPAYLARLEGPSPDPREGAARFFASRGPSLTAPLIEALRTDDRRARRHAVGLLGRIGPEAVPALVACLGDDRHPHRDSAATALGEIGPPAVAPLLRFLDDAPPDAKPFAAMALGKIGPGAKEAVPALARLLRNPRRATRVWAIFALGEIGPPALAALPAIREAMADESLAAHPFVIEAVKKLEAAGAGALRSR